MGVPRLAFLGIFAGLGGKTLLKPNVLTWGGRFFQKKKLRKPIFETQNLGKGARRRPRFFWDTELDMDSFSEIDSSYWLKKCISGQSYAMCKMRKIDAKSIAFANSFNAPEPRKPAPTHTKTKYNPEAPKPQKPRPDALKPRKYYHPKKSTWRDSSS